ncbi:BglG family transcription antiterminator [Gemella cuniculi]|uniref:BglG family transcription antiterminator n=1 Tax=Gemella cuniculi TaxID=150240 RepID=UPI0003FE6C19|nr:PTS sugar transporter subunit IIA [Gemella cuniculi]
MFSEREKLILQILLKNNEALSIKEIAKATKIKERTLYREIKNLEDSLNSLGVELVKEKSKYLIQGNKSSLDSSLFETNFEDHAYSTETRLNLILCFLILNEDTSIKEISEKLMLSYNTVASTIVTVEKILIDYKLKLIRKKGQGIEIIGGEVERRTLLVSLLCNEIGDEEFFTRINKKETLSSNPFIKFLNFDFLSELFNKNRELEIFNVYTDSSIKKLLISLNIVFLRIDYEVEIKEKISSDEREYIVSLLTASKNIIDYEISEDIIEFLVKILKTCRLIEQLSYFNDKYSYTLIYKINQLIKHVSEKMNVDFTQDTNLSSGLIAHIESAIKRYQMKLTEENEDLLEFVLKNYNELYLVIKSELLVVFDEINFNSTELSYIVIHFASSYEQIYRKNFIRALVICASGIGSSKILGSQIRKSIPEIKNLEYTIPSKITKKFSENYDVIISTIELNKDIDYLLLPTILKEKDIERIRKKILENRSFRRKNSVELESTVNLDEVSTFCNDILKNVNCVEIDNDQNNKESLLKALEVANLTLNSKEEIVQSLLERHEKSSIVIPTTNLALFHTLNNNLETPFIVICKLKNNIEMKDVSDSSEDVNIFFVMVSPNKENYTSLLGQISIAILNDEVLKKALVSGNEDFIKTKLELIMKNYILQY